MQKGRNIYFDYLRGIAALLVVLFHYTTRYDMLFGHKDSLLISFPHGSFAVLTFFI